MLNLENIEFHDVLIWGALAFIILRYTLPKILELLGLPVTKVTKPRDGGGDDRGA